MGAVRNILFIMCDQLRFDHLSCYGHPRLHTPHIDALAARGVRFDRAYVQSPVCGASRMSFYTGRYVHAHGASWNFVPLKAGEMTIGDHLRPLGVRSVLVGKTHMRADTMGMARLGIDPRSMIGVRISECGFDPFERDDGIHPYSGHDPHPRYNDYLREQGFEGENPWEEWANSAEGDNGELLSGWFLKNAIRPARVPEQHSETPYITRRAMDFIRDAGPEPWCLHLSYIKPHWPYIVPEPYASMYTAEDALPVVRDVREKHEPHPVYGAFMNHRVSRAFSRDEVRAAVMPAYMGLIKQIDDQMGVLFGFLEEHGLMESTMIVFTSDHGDYLGDHWLGDKDLFHEPSVRVPLIIYDPDARADATRGSVCSELVEAIDLTPTFIDVYGGAAAPHAIDGRSLRPLMFGDVPQDWRRHVVSEYDYSFIDARIELGTKSREAWLRMIFDGRYKYVLAEGYRPMLFDLEADPHEFVDRGGDPALADVRARLEAALFRWARQPRQRATIPDAAVETTPVQQRITQSGVLIGYWDEAELREAERSFRPLFATYNPLVRPTLDKLLDPPRAVPRATRQGVNMIVSSQEQGGITRAQEGIGGIVWNVLGQAYVPKQVSEASFAWMATLPIESFIPPHIHDTQDEYIFVVDGALDLLLDGQRRSATTGDLVRMPRGIPHGIFNNAGSIAPCLFWVTPTAKLVDLFSALHNVADTSEVVRISAAHDVRFLPPTK